LQAIAKDGIIPFLKPFEMKAANGEPIRALGITLLICEVAVLIGKCHAWSRSRSETKWFGSQSYDF
jgi:hypothetical protein